MLLSFQQYDGRVVKIDSSQIFSARPRLESFDPPEVQTVISYFGPSRPRHKKLPTKTAPGEIVALLRTALPIARLTTVDGGPIYVDAAKVTDIRRPTDNSPMGTNAVLVISTVRLPVAETVADARTIIDGARGGPAPGARRAIRPPV
jgi:hypothetical protein